MRGCLATLPSNTTAGKPGRALSYKSIRNGNLYGKIPQSLLITNNNALLIDIFLIRSFVNSSLAPFCSAFLYFSFPKLYSSKAMLTALGATPKRIKQPIHLHLQINDGLLLFAKATQETQLALQSLHVWGTVRALQRAGIRVLCFPKFTQPRLGTPPHLLEHNSGMWYCISKSLFCAAACKQ